MTQHASPAARPPGDTTRPHRLPVRAAVLTVTTVVTTALVLGLALAGPAAAEVPAQGWPENEPVNVLDALLLIGGVSLAVILVVTVMTVGPASKVKPWSR